MEECAESSSNAELESKSDNVDGEGSDIKSGVQDHRAQCIDQLDSQT